ncbi:nucleotide pyrophosphohydrolase [Celeribacter halophilus]|uniref:Nucleotide pyrophosphohydrolase n=1 Tax=Celeribacter halophilus TaxID=576117 RepID=A0AAW7XMX5_9RHOB|nr:nucleotide pyrophosphohydrolase [Celeribacter halophilus]MDO6455608.1 nucleotide pyrophosphohydrolase [Celeribacter halophilus]
MHDLIARLKKFRDDRDWEQFHTPQNLAVSISIEAAELLEIFQWHTEDKLIDDTVRDEIKGELADIFSYMLLLCDRVEIDLIEATNSKIDLNEKRFPVLDSRSIAKPEDRLK